MRFPLPFGDFPPATCLDWTLMGDLCKGIGYVTLQKVKAKKRLLYLECSINYDAKGTSSRWGKGKTHVF
jgi:hypothetical protein